MIAVVDYGAGNVCSVMHALEHIGAPSILTREEGEIARADRGLAVEALNPQTLRNYLVVHTWVGILCGMVLFIAFTRAPSP